MQDFDEKKIFYSDEDNNFDLPLDLIQDTYDKREDEDKDEDQDDQIEEIDLENEDDEDSYYLERIDEVQEILEEICESIPAYAFDHLNGGIILS